MRYFLELAYLGTAYHGWQLQPNAITIQEILDQKLSALLAEPIYTLGCGRTDAGVHAKNFYAHFDSTKNISNQLITNLNGMLPSDIVAKKFILVKDDAHARFDAISRGYEYRMHFFKNPFVESQSYYFHFKNKPDIHLMNDAAKLLLTHQDFECFSKTHSGSSTSICKINYAYWEQTEDGFIFKISANRFLRNMVRAIVGTLLDVGIGRINLTEFQQILASRNRSNAGTSVPANGLALVSVIYPDGYLKD